MSRVQSIERAFAVLSALSDGPTGVSAIAERARLPKSTVVRLLRALQTEGAVEQQSGDGRYRLGPRVAQLAAGLTPTRTLVALGRPVLSDLAAAVGEVAGLGVPEGRVVHYIDQVGTAHQVQIRDWTGSRAPMHAVSSGQVFLAHEAPEVIEAYVARDLVQFTARTLVTADALRERLRQVALDGYAWARDEFTDGMSSVAAPVTDAAGEVVAAIHVHGPSYRFPAEGLSGEVVRLLLDAAQRLSIRLRHG
jgi:DNA-binding IclR family transcriptional regulator